MLEDRLKLQIRAYICSWDVQPMDLSVLFCLLHTFTQSLRSILQIVYFEYFRLKAVSFVDPQSLI